MFADNDITQWVEKNQLKFSIRQYNLTNNIFDFFSLLFCIHLSLYVVLLIHPLPLVFLVHPWPWLWLCSSISFPVLYDIHLPSLSLHHLLLLLFNIALISISWQRTTYTPTKEYQKLLPTLAMHNMCPGTDNSFHARAVCCSHSFFVWPLAEYLRYHTSICWADSVALEETWPHENVHIYILRRLKIVIPVLKI